MSTKATDFIDGLISYDYILFGSAFVLFILFIVLSILVRKKVSLAVIFLLLGFSVLILGPSFGYVKMHEYLFKNSLVLETQQELSFTQAVLVKGTLRNDSRFDFSTCKITASAYRVTSNQYKNYLLKFKPFQNGSILTPEIQKGATYEFKVFIEPFTYSKEYNISLGANCK